MLAFIFLADIGKIANRLGLRPPRDAINEPWRHWILLYLAALAEIADYERTNFGPVEAAAALETLRKDAEDMQKQLRRGKRP
jgi:hypothetical protein